MRLPSSYEVDEGHGTIGAVRHSASGTDDNPYDVHCYWPSSTVTIVTLTRASPPPVEDMLQVQWSADTGKPEWNFGPGCIRTPGQPYKTPGSRSSELISGTLDEWPEVSRNWITLFSHLLYASCRAILNPAQLLLIGSSTRHDRHDGTGSYV